MKSPNGSVSEIISSGGKRQCSGPSQCDPNLFLLDFALGLSLEFDFRLVPLAVAFRPCSANTAETSELFPQVFQPPLGDLFGVKDTQGNQSI